MNERIFVVLANRCYRSFNSLRDAYMEFSEYVTDESGTPVGARLKYCKDEEDWPGMSDEVILHPYEKFYFTYWYIDITGPSDWSSDYISYDITLLPYADMPNEIREKVDTVGYCFI